MKNGWQLLAVADAPRMQAAPRPKPVPLPLRAQRWRVAPAPLPERVINELLKNEPPSQPTLREEIAAYKAGIQARKAARLAVEAAAAAPAAKAKKPQSPIRLNRESSKFRDALRDWLGYYKSLLKYGWGRMRERAIPVLCCLTAEVDDGAHEPSNRDHPPNPQR